MLTHDLPAAWNAPSTNERTKLRLTRIPIQEIVIDQKDDAKDAVVTVIGPADAAPKSVSLASAQGGFPKIATEVLSK